MLTSWLWIHSPDRHRGVDVVCSNRSLGLESTSSVVSNDCSFPRSTSTKKERPHWRPQRTAQEKFRRSTMHPLACSSIDRRRRRFFLIHSSLSCIIQSTTELFWNLRLLFAFEWSPCIVPGNWKKVHWGEEDSLKRPRIIGPGVEWRRKAAVDRNHDDAYASWRDVRLRRVTKTKWRNCREPP